MFQYSCLENPPPWQRSLTGHSLQDHRIRHDQSDLVHIDTKLFLPVATLPKWELSMKVAQLLGLWGPWPRQVCRDMDCLCCRCYGLIRVFFRSCCSWRSEGLFGQSFSLAPPVQALRGFPFLGPSPYSFNIFKICSDISLDNGNVFTLFSFSSSVWLGCN